MMDTYDKPLPQQYRFIIGSTQKLSNPSRQRGAILVLALLLMVMVSFLAFTSIDSLSLAQKVDQSHHSSFAALQSAQSTLESTEQLVLAQSPQLTIHPLSPDWKATWQQDNPSKKQQLSLTSMKQADQRMSKQPQVLIEETTAAQDDLLISAKQGFHSLQTIKVYRITAQGVGYTPAHTRYVQSQYRTVITR